MKKPIKKIWVKALKSGKYRRGRECLRDGRKFCCLGVLCDIYVKEHKKIKWKNDGKIFGEGGVLPLEVRKWAGLQSPNPTVGVKTGECYAEGDMIDGRLTLATLNDRGTKFKTIAKIINREL